MTAQLINNDNTTCTVPNETRHDRKIRPVVVKNEEQLLLSKSLLISDNGNDPKTYLNLQALDGIRCLTSIGIIIVHAFIITGVPLFLRESTCFNAISELPIISLFIFRVSWHMTLFWILSGFLCEYQLYTMYMKKHQQQNKITNGTTDGKEELNGKQKQRQHRTQTTSTHITWKELFVFWTNRFLRLYPLYIILPTIIFFKNRNDPQLFDLYPLHEWIKTLLFIKQWDAEFTSGVCSVQVDMHGYIAIIALFAITHKFTYKYGATLEERRKSTLPKRILLITWYLLSLVNVLTYNPFSAKNVSEESVESIRRYGPLGIDTMADKLLRLYRIEQLGGRAAMYPDFDFNKNEEIRTLYLRLMKDTYFGSIFNHGSAMMLGSLLFVNLYQRQWQPSYPVLKLVFSFLFLIGTSGWHSVSGIASYFLIESILTLKASKDGDMVIISLSRWLNIFVDGTLKFLTISFFRFLAPYTYGIYLFHAVPLFKLMERSLQSKVITIINGAKNGVDSCQALSDAGQPFTILFLAKQSVLSFVIGLIISMILNRFVEKPILWLRKEWIPNNLYNKYKKDIQKKVS